MDNLQQVKVALEKTQRWERFLTKPFFLDRFDESDGHPKTGNSPD